MSSTDDEADFRNEIARFRLADLPRSWDRLAGFSSVRGLPKRLSRQL